MFKLSEVAKMVLMGGLMVLLPLAFAIGALVGDPPEERVKWIEAHNDAVVACTEQAAKRYSVILPGDPNLWPDWAKDERVPMFDLDAYYRDPWTPYPDRKDDGVPYYHYGAWDTYARVYIANAKAMNFEAMLSINPWD